MSDARMTVRDRVTIRTVAEDAGVSVAAVSKVMRNAYGVSEALRANVQESIGRLGYRPSTAARGMRGRTHTIGILLVEMANPFLPGLVGAINSVLLQAGYKSLIGVGEAQLKIETSLIDSMIDFRMDGLVLVAPRLAGRMLDQFAEQIPLVAIGHHEPGSSTFDTVNSDDVEGAKIAVQALLDAGHRKIHMVSLPARANSEIDVYRQRETGYIEAMRGAGLENQIKIHRAHEINPAKTTDLEVIIQDSDATALFCWSDIHAVAISGVARSAGLAIPGDLAIIGYDNSPLTAHPTINLASIDQDAGRLGALAANLLMSRIGGRKSSEHALLKPHLVRRGSF